MNKSKKGGSRSNAGRPAIADKTKSRTMRLTDTDYAKFKLLGGVKWLRQLLDNTID